MVSCGARGGRGGSPFVRACALSAVEELERQHRISDAACIRGSYRNLRQGLQPTPAFQRRESQYNRQLQSLSSCCSSSASRAPPPRRLNFGETSSSRAPHVDDGEASSSHGPRLVPRFDPSDYVDNDIPMLAAELERNTPALTAGDFGPASVLGTVTALLEEKTRRDAEKAEEWRREQEAQDAKYVELSDSDESE